MKRKITSIINFLLISSIFFSISFEMSFAADALDTLKNEGFGNKNYDNDPGTIQQRGADGAIEEVKTTDSSSPAEQKGNDTSGGATTVTVTEKIPGMDCDAIPPKAGEKVGPESNKYKCTIQPGFGSVMLILKGLIKYATFITALIGVLMLVVSGVQYSIAGADKGAADAAKKRIEKVLAGIVLLFLIGFILNSVAPWVYTT
ncbi:MAG: hypothetical protein PHH16_04175 [Candidatus Gracilibacteria bacterium]|nr:hypothetical protein [Candidatus Gracilibacteria bacterium]